MWDQALLQVIRSPRRKSLTELTEPIGRRVPNLSRTLRMMEGYGLVTLKKNVRESEPVALATECKVMLG